MNSASRWRIVPVLYLPYGYYEILSDSQRAELGDMMQRAYDTQQSDDERIEWLTIESGGNEDGWAIFIPMKASKDHVAITDLDRRT